MFSVCSSGDMQECGQAVARVLSAWISQVWLPLCAVLLFWRPDLLVPWRALLGRGHPPSFRTFVKQRTLAKRAQAAGSSGPQPLPSQLSPAGPHSPSKPVAGGGLSSSSSSTGRQRGSMRQAHVVQVLLPCWLQRWRFAVGAYADLLSHGCRGNC